MRAWAKKEGRKSNLSEGSPGRWVVGWWSFFFIILVLCNYRIIMNKREDTDDTVCFDEHPLANPDSRKNSLKRFQMNPERNWGPKMRSKTSTLKNMENSKKLKNQGKYSKKKLSEEGDMSVKKLRTDSGNND